MEADADGTALWQRRLNDLRAWKEEHGHCTVPKAEGKLGRWVVRQRELFKKGKLDPGRQAQLDSLTFVWNTNDAAWQYRYDMLTQYTIDNGHCCVPIAHPQLGMWVAKMRANHRRGKLPECRVRKLQRIGFVWNTAEADWMDKFEKLLQFRQTHGHSCVPFNEGELGWWVNTQRQCKRKGKLMVDREKLLDQAGFVWNPQQFLAARRRNGLVSAANEISDCQVAPKAPPEDALLNNIGDSMDSESSPNSVRRTDPESENRSMKSNDLDLTQCHFQVQGSDSADTITTRLSRFSDELMEEATPSSSNVIQLCQVNIDQKMFDQDEQSSAPSTNASSLMANVEGSGCAPPLVRSSWKCDRGDVQSIASLLSPLPQPTPLHSNNRLDADMDIDHELPSYHYGGIFNLLGWRQHAVRHDFVLPPISSLKAVRDGTNLR